MKLTSFYPLIALASLHLGAATPPNIVILYADDMGYGDVGAYNAKSKIPTPNLDALAAGGMRFTDGHSSSGFCTPSRYAMLTGRHHWRDFHGIVNAFGPSVFKKGQLTLPEMLRRKGYATAAIGKWHLGWDWSAIRKPGTSPTSIEVGDFDWTKPIPDGPTAHGFETYFGDDVINFPPYTWFNDDKVAAIPDTMLRKVPGAPKEGAWECRPGPARSDWDFYRDLPTVTRKAVEYVRSRQGDTKPFFLYLPFPSPHAPIVPVKAFDGRSKAGAYGDYVAQTDDACGQVLAALKESGLDGNTVVIFSADNGPELYAYDRDAEFDHWSPEPFRGLKGDNYEGGHHVPFLVRWPGVTKPGTVSGALISQVDLMATFADVAGCELGPDAAADSYDFLPFLKGAVPIPPRNVLIQNTQKDQYAIREGDWLLVDYKTGYGTGHLAPDAWLKKHATPAGGDKVCELFNMKNDPGQRLNVADEHPELVAELRAQLKKIREQGHSAPRLD